MLNAKHGPATRLVGLIVAGALSVGGLALAIPAVAHPDHSSQEVTERKVIIHGGAGDKDFTESTAPGELERFGTHCDGDKVEITADGGGSNKKQAIKLFICGDKGEGAKGLAEALSKAMTNIDKDNRDVDPKIRAELRAKIEAKIRELRTKG
jgi:hypothetical protein